MNGNIRTEEQAKTLIESLMPLQEDEDQLIPFPCPRCGHHRMDPVAAKNALSRHAKVYICPVCGIDEAARDMKGAPLPLNQWSMAISF